jgi:hypothetical protein
MFAGECFGLVRAAGVEPCGRTALVGADQPKGQCITGEDELQWRALFADGWVWDEDLSSGAYPAGMAFVVCGELTFGRVR